MEGGPFAVFPLRGRLGKRHGIGPSPTRSAPPSRRGGRRQAVRPAGGGGLQRPGTAVLVLGAGGGNAGP